MNTAYNFNLYIKDNWGGSIITVKNVYKAGGAHPVRAPPKIGKNMIVWRKIEIFHTKYPNNFRASLRNWKKYDFLA
jgi:hypothetical protein